MFDGIVRCFDSLLRLRSFGISTPSDDSVSSKIKSLMEEIRVLNTELDKDKKISIDKRVLRSKQRRPIRLKWKRAHRKLEAEISTLPIEEKKEFLEEIGIEDRVGRPE